jgi:ADP-dependent phosphofructokinase/glucokinase
MMINNKRVLIKFGSCPNDNRYYNQSRLRNIRHTIRQQTKRQLKDIADSYSVEAWLLSRIFADEDCSWDNFIQPIC